MQPDLTEEVTRSRFAAARWWGVTQWISLSGVTLAVAAGAQYAVTGQTWVQHTTGSVFAAAVSVLVVGAILGYLGLQDAARVELRRRDVVRRARDLEVAARTGDVPSVKAAGYALDGALRAAVAGPLRIKVLPRRATEDFSRHLREELAAESGLSTATLGTTQCLARLQGGHESGPRGGVRQRDVS